MPKKLEERRAIAKAYRKAQRFAKAHRKISVCHKCRKEPVYQEGKCVVCFLYKNG